MFHRGKTLNFQLILKKSGTKLADRVIVVRFSRLFSKQLLKWTREVHTISENS